MAIGHIRIGMVNITFVFRHKFEKPDDPVAKFHRDMELRNWELGLWYKHNKIVGKKDFISPNKWKNNLVRSHMIGINLLVCKVWIEINKGGKNFPLK